MRQTIGDPGSISTQNMFPLISVVPKAPESPHGAKCSFLQNIRFFSFLSFWTLLHLVARPREPGLEICRPLPRPPRKFKEGGWEIHGKSLGNPWEIRGKSGGVHPRLDQKSQGLKTSWSVVFFGFLSFVDEVPIQWH